MGREARVKRERRTVKKAAGSPRTIIDLSETTSLINRLLSESLCREVFSTTRTNERKRLWSLYTLAEFWTRIILRGPESLTQALEEALRGEGVVWPRLPGAPQSFFERSQTLKWTFFDALYHGFAKSLTQSAPQAYEAPWASLRKHFPEVWIVDGSRLDAVAHRLKILWDVRSAVLPGCLIAFYDMFRGYPRLLHFDPNAAEAEMNRVRETLGQVPAGTLLLGDRLYASVKLFEDLTSQGIWGLCRLKDGLSMKKLNLLKRRRVNGGILEDWLIELGSGQTAAKQRVRYIRFRRAKGVYELLTNVLDPKKLSAETAMELYPRRWNVERMFFHLKEVLNLHRFYTANPNGVAMQVYAAAMVYAALRVAQSDAARQAQVEPEEISPAKFFPRVAEAFATRAGIELGYRMTCLENPGRRLRPPNLRGRPELTTTLEEVRVEKRNGRRRKRRFCKGRRKWKSFAHVPGGKKLIN